DLVHRTLQANAGQAIPAAAALAAYADQAGFGREGVAKLEYAHERMLALARLNMIASDDARLAAVTERLFHYYRRMGWYEAARRIIPPAGDVHGEPLAWHLHLHGMLLWTIGDGQDAIDTLTRVRDMG